MINARSKTIILVLSTAFFVLGGLLFAGGTKEGGTSMSPVTVTLWMHDDPPRVPLDKQVFADFQTKNSNITVDYRVVAVAEFSSRLLTALASGKGPDLFNEFTGSIGDFYGLGALAPYDVNLGEIGSLYPSWALAGAMFGGKLYGLPTEVSNYACYTNDSLWKAAGLNPQTDFPKTWEQLVSVAQRLTIRDNSGALTQRGFDLNWTDPGFFMLQFPSMVRQLGGKMFSESTYAADIDTPQVKKAMQYWYDWVNTWKLGGPQYTDSRQAFLAGQLATECSMGYPFVPVLQKAGIVFSVHPIPRWKDAVNDVGLDLYAYYLMVNAHSQSTVQSAAWKLAELYDEFSGQVFQGSRAAAAQEHSPEFGRGERQRSAAAVLVRSGQEPIHVRVPWTNSGDCYFWTGTGSDHCRQATDRCCSCQRANANNSCYSECQAKMSVMVVARWRVTTINS